MNKMVATLALAGFCAAAPALADVKLGQYTVWQVNDPVLFATLCLQTGQNWHGNARGTSANGYWLTGAGISGHEIRIVGGFISTDKIPTHYDITIDDRNRKGDWMTWSDSKNAFGDYLVFIKFQMATCDSSS